MVVEPPPCSGRPRAYEGARRCLGFSLFRMSVAARLRQSPVAGDSTAEHLSGPTSMNRRGLLCHVSETVRHRMS